MKKKTPKNTDAYLINGQLILPHPNAVKQIKAGKPMTLWIKDQNKKLLKVIKLK